ncbi:MAG: Fis family transcriptional regulator, partial [Desulfurococcales archaeon ex4484_58]
MVIIYEIAAKKIIPSVKGILVHKLYEKGYSQRKIAGILDLTQPQIHKYLNKPINYYYEKLSIEGLDTDRIEHYIKVLISAIEKGDQLKYTLMINSIIHELLMNIVCREYRIFKQFCEKGRLTDPNIEYYREWLDKITRKPKLNKLIPEVGTNIVYSPSKPLNQSDIIGLTGRIVKVGSS